MTGCQKQSPPTFFAQRAALWRPGRTADAESAASRHALRRPAASGRDTDVDWEPDRRNRDEREYMLHRRKWGYSTPRALGIYGRNPPPRERKLHAMELEVDHDLPRNEPPHL